MVSRDLTLQNESGFHIYPAKQFTELASRYISSVSVTVKATSTTVDGKSILGLMTLGLSKGAQITVTVEGPDEAVALQNLSELIETKFGEE
ncbi:phosphocarrier protein HPr/phosphocarrier protein [Paenibacillus phyllosphaerae]|uniref:Phosphocarrier protein HPr/phosphocarrier protein n=1 Tax=Paenibacillus phyllosphaerae TaxID=274593 RepID=A0A7W5AU54_9BACL|nr:HPr family phosphocarrier protein [Paenibacillus phyllosphaerae]MBB3108186.1 phosphocarrier protein HPr/phosphocarrier protein [Paenibacillus phyllosphaerae]